MILTLCPAQHQPGLQLFSALKSNIKTSLNRCIILSHRHNGLRIVNNAIGSAHAHRWCYMIRQVNGTAKACTFKIAVGFGLMDSRCR